MVDDERGAVTVLAALIVAVLLSLTGAAAVLGSAVLARHRAQAAADLAALAAASSVPGGVELACGRARQVLDAMRVGLVDCAIDGADVVIVVQMPALAGTAHAGARAGPV